MARATAIANAVRKLAAGLSAHRDVSGCYAVLALAVERLGDPASAATIREMVSKTMRFGDASSVSGVVQRYEPTELDGELVLDGEAGKTLRALARDLSIAHRFVAAGVDAPTRCLFVGPSGVGKTLSVRWLGGVLGIPVFITQVSRVVESHLGATSQNVAKAFELAAALPSILFLDEIDAICSERSSDTSAAARELERSTSSLLQLIDALPPEQIVIAATNLPDRIDEALKRRLSTIVEFPLPSLEARRRMVDVWTARVVMTDEERASLLGTVLLAEGRCGASLRAEVMAIARDAVRRTWSPEAPAPTAQEASA